VVAQLGKAAHVDTGVYARYVPALETRRRYFVEYGAVSADHSHVDVRTDPLEPSEAARIYRSALAADATRRRPLRSGGTCCWRWLGCRATTGW
jgi:glucuronate isomerase